jgi:hypothetical protein
VQNIVQNKFRNVGTVFQHCPDGPVQLAIAQIHRGQIDAANIQVFEIKAHRLFDPQLRYTSSALILASFLVQSNLS